MDSPLDTCVSAVHVLRTLHDWGMCCEQGATGTLLSANGTDAALRRGNTSEAQLGLVPGDKPDPAADKGVAGTSQAHAGTSAHNIKSALSSDPHSH